MHGRGVPNRLGYGPQALEWLTSYTKKLNQPAKARTVPVANSHENVGTSVVPIVAPSESHALEIQGLNYPTASNLDVAFDLQHTFFL